MKIKLQRGSILLLLRRERSGKYKHLMRLMRYAQRSSKFNQNTAQIPSEPSSQA